jgi:ribosome maturation factor RimP
VTVAERVYDTIEPLVTARDLELVDVEHVGDTLRVVIDREGGVDLDTIGQLAKAVSLTLDEDDPIGGRYTLEVSSPGLERGLRKPEHFQRAVGETVVVKTRPHVEGERRLSGILTSATDNAIVVTVDSVDHELAYSDIDKARTSFEWGPAPKPGKKPGKKRAAAS